MACRVCRRPPLTTCPSLNLYFAHSGIGDGGTNETSKGHDRHYAAVAMESPSTTSKGWHNHLVWIAVGFPPLRRLGWRGRAAATGGVVRRSSDHRKLTDVRTFFLSGGEFVQKIRLLLDTSLKPPVLGRSSGSGQCSRLLRHAKSSTRRLLLLGFVGKLLSRRVVRKDSRVGGWKRGDLFCGR